jgi:BRCA1/BRCA2-containing complex subunit 3
VIGLEKIYGFYSHHDTNHSTNYEPRESVLVPHNPDNTQEAYVDPYDSDMTPSLLEALHWSTMDIRYPNNE